MEDHLGFANAASANVKRQIEEYIASAGLDAPPVEPDPAEIVAQRLPSPQIQTLDPAAIGIMTVIWCVGFRGDFGWVRLPGVLDADGQPLQDDGATVLPGIFFAGVDFGSTRKSGIILAIEELASRLADHIVARVTAGG
ncbi:NAD(P)-binding domain-containing protein [Mesorhizobium sp. M0016]|uniref:hypothetical protein n=1 Tax=Mesorhizobium sp. M0016 TaxID=2956843 RepID=UPI003335D662